MSGDGGAQTEQQATVDVSGDDGDSQKAEHTFVPSSTEHIDGRICTPDKNCSECARRVFRLTLNYFHCIYHERTEQSMKPIICRLGWSERDADRKDMLERPAENEVTCDYCQFAKWEDAICPTCKKETGKVYAGYIAFEACQYHHERCTTGTTSFGDSTGLKSCPCTVHMRLHLFCSPQCLKDSDYKEAVRANPFKADTERIEGSRLRVASKGPLLIVKHYKAATDAEMLGNTKCGGFCIVCGAAAKQRCSRCKRGAYRYCSTDCFKNDWKRHKLLCKPE